jgi:hypothetical protein
MKQSTEPKPYVPSKETLEKLRRVLQGDYDTTDQQKNQTEERKSQQ